MLPSRFRVGVLTGLLVCGVAVGAGPAGSAAARVRPARLAGSWRLLRSNTPRARKARLVYGALVLSPVGTFSLSRLFVVGRQTFTVTASGIYRIKGKALTLLVSRSTDRTMTGRRRMRFRKKGRYLRLYHRKGREIWFRWTRRTE